ncbi:MAG: archease [Bdellovibrionia bacterium]
MTYQYLDHLTWADVAFEASGETLEELFVSASEAILKVMIAHTFSIQKIERREIFLVSEYSDLVQSVDFLLHAFLQKLIFYKDAEQLLLKPREVRFQHTLSNKLNQQAEGKIFGKGLELYAEVWGEKIDSRRHELITDVKAVTMHQFHVERRGSVWHAQVVIDV